MRKKVHIKNQVPLPLSSALCTHSSVRIFYGCLLRGKKSLVKECGQEYISCLSGALGCVGHISLPSL